MLVFISVLVAIIIAVIGYVIYRRISKPKLLDTTPQDLDGNPIDEEDDDISESPVYEDDNIFENWDSWEDFLKQVGIIDIRDGMIEYESGDNSRIFVMLAEMQQSNPFLKSDPELQTQNESMETFLHTLSDPIKISSQPQRIEMTDFLKHLRENAMNLNNATKEMKNMANLVLDDTINYQNENDRFENRCYIQFLCTVKRDEVIGDTPEEVEYQIHKKALTKLLEKVTLGDQVLHKEDHALAPLDQFGLLEVLYRTFNKDSSINVRFEDIVRNQRFSIYVHGKQDDKMYKSVQQKIQVFTQAVEEVRDKLWHEKQQQNAEKLMNGEDYYNTDNVED